MLDAIFACTVATVICCCLNLEIIGATPIVEYEKGLRYEEYIVEHEISASQAKNAALSMDLRSVSSPPGCQNCTKAEMKYCLGRDLISDHCCCDRRFREVLPFIPHTCYMGTQICKPVVKDCAEYSKLRICCCDKYVLEKWKKRSKGVVSANVNLPAVVTSLVLHFFLYIFVHFRHAY